MNSYVKNLIKSLPEEYQILSLKENLQWEKPLKDLCISITKSEDLKCINYSEKRFPIKKQIDIILLVSKNKILAFSSLWKASHFPKNYVRALNRSWEEPSIRGPKNMFQRKIMLIILAYQIDIVLKNKDIDFIFLSMEGIRSNWWKRWVFWSNKIYEGWKIYPKMIKVCDGSYSKCWQSCVYLSLKTKGIYKFSFPSVTFEEWLKLIKTENSKKHSP